MLQLTWPTGFLWPTDFNSVRYIPRSRTAGWHGSSVFTCLRNLYTAFRSGCAIYNPTTAGTGVPCCSHPCHHLSPVSLDDSHSDRHCGSDLHVPDDWWGASFHAPVGHLYVFFGKMSVQVLCPFFTGVILALCSWVIWGLHINLLLRYNLQIFSPAP